MAAVVLAGGRSRRMGRDKALLPFGDASLLVRVLERMRAADSRVILVLDRPDRYAAGQIPGDVEIAIDARDEAGPLAGLIAGLGRAGPGIHVVAACDMPLISAALLRFLAAAASGRDAAAPVIADRLQPLCAAYDYRCCARLRSISDAGERSLTRAVMQLDLRTVEESEILPIDPSLSSFTNINTMEEYETALTSG